MKLMVRPWKSMVGRLLFGMPFTTNQRRDLLQGGVFVQRIRSSCEKLNSLTVRSRMPSSYKKVEFLLLLVLMTFFSNKTHAVGCFWWIGWGASQHPETPPGGGCFPPMEILWFPWNPPWPMLPEQPYVHSTWSYADRIHPSKEYIYPANFALFMWPCFTFSLGEFFHTFGASGFATAVEGCCFSTIARGGMYADGRGHLLLASQGHGPCSGLGVTKNIGIFSFK